MDYGLSKNHSWWRWRDSKLCFLVPVFIGNARRREDSADQWVYLCPEKWSRFVHGCLVEQQCPLWRFRTWKKATTDIAIRWTAGAVFFHPRIFLVVTLQVKPATSTEVLPTNLVCFCPGTYQDICTRMWTVKTYGSLNKKYKNIFSPRGCGITPHTAVVSCFAADSKGNDSCVALGSLKSARFACLGHFWIICDFSSISELWTKPQTWGESGFCSIYSQYHLESWFCKGLKFQGMLRQRNCLSQCGWKSRELVRDPA